MRWTEKGGIIKICFGGRFLAKVHSPPPLQSPTRSLAPSVFSPHQTWKTTGHWRLNENKYTSANPEQQYTAACEKPL